MSMFDHAEKVNIHDGRFSIIMGNVYYYSPPDEAERSTATERKPLPELTHIFKKTRVLKQDDFCPVAAAYSHDGSQILAISSESPAVIIWDAVIEPNRPPTHHQLIEGKTWASFVEISPDGSRVAVGPITTLHVDGNGQPKTLVKDETTLVLRDLETGNTAHYKETLGHLVATAVSSDGVKLVTSAFGHIRLWDLRSGGSVVGKGHVGLIFPVAFSPDGKKIVSVGEYSKDIIIWETQDAKSLELESMLQNNYASLHESTVKVVEFFPDGARIALGFEDGEILILDAETGDLVSGADDFKGHEGWITCIVFSADGKWMVSSSHDGTARVWNVATGQAISKPLKGHSDSVMTVALSPDQRNIVSASVDGSLVIWTLQ